MEREPGMIRSDGDRRQIKRSEAPSDLLESGAVARVTSEEEPVIWTQDRPAAPQRLRNTEEPQVVCVTENCAGIRPAGGGVFIETPSARGRHLVVVQRCAFAPVLRRRADERDVVVARHAVLLPPVQLDDVLAAHLHQPVHQAQRNEPGREEVERKIKNAATMVIDKLIKYLTDKWTPSGYSQSSLEKKNLKTKMPVLFNFIFKIKLK